MLKIDNQICLTTIPPLQNFIGLPSKESGVIEFRWILPPSPRLDRGIERPRLDRVKKSHMTSDIVYVPINYIRNHHYNFLNRNLKKSHPTSDV